MGKVKFDSLVSKTLNELIPVLYIEGYFATREYAKAYVDGILAFCYAIPQRTAQLSRTLSMVDITANTNQIVVLPGTFFLLPKRMIILFNAL